MKKKSVKIDKITWKTEENEIAEQGRPALRYRIEYPQITQQKYAKSWNRYYLKMAEGWIARWTGRCASEACAELRQKEGAARPWSCALSGETTLLDDQFLSVHFTAGERRGDGRLCLVEWGDVWSMADGRPVGLAELIGRGRSARRSALEQIRVQGNERAGAGLWLPDGNWLQQAEREWRRASFWLTGEGVQISFPQSVLAHPAEGTPRFLLDRKNPPQPELSAG